MIHTVKGSGVVNKAEIDVSPLVNTMALGLPLSSGTGLIINTCYRDAYGASLMAQMVKNLSAMQEIWVQSLGWGDPLEEGMHGNLLQYSCLENPMDRGAWWTKVHGVAKIQPRLSN